MKLLLINTIKHISTVHIGKPHKTSFTIFADASNNTGYRWVSSIVMKHCAHVHLVRHVRSPNLQLLTEQLHVCSISS